MIHRKGNIFQQPLEGLYLAHACNCKGVWGAGIAREFAQRFPRAYQRYLRESDESSFYKLGSSLVIPDGDVHLVCLYTSVDYGKRKDPPERILKATKLALNDLWLKLPEGAQVHSPKFNSGLFAVPWEATQEILEDALEDRPDVRWTVWSLK